MDHRRPPTPDLRVAQELAECLQRFLAASADERTMVRAQEALARWQAQRSGALSPR